jgi:hypothetical protein
LQKIPLARVAAWSGFGMVLICTALKWQMPGLDLLPLFWKLPIALLGSFFLICLNAIGVYLLIPPRFTITGRSIRYSHGEAGWVSPIEECSAFKLIVYSPTHRRLSFRLKGKLYRMGLAETVDLEELRTVLASQLKSLDASRRFAYLQKKRESTF